MIGSCAVTTLGAFVGAVLGGILGSLTVPSDRLLREVDVLEWVLVGAAIGALAPFVLLAVSALARGLVRRRPDRP